MANGNKNCTPPHQIKVRKRKKTEVKIESVCMHQRLIRIAPARSPPQNNMIIVREIIEKKNV